MEELSFKIVRMRGLRDEVIADLQSGVPEALFVYSDSVLLGPKVGQRSSVSENSLRVLIGRLAV